jgi:hypothetical protein
MPRIELGGNQCWYSRSREWRSRHQYLGLVKRFGRWCYSDALLVFLPGLLCEFAVLVDMRNVADEMKDDKGDDLGEQHAEDPGEGL